MPANRTGRCPRHRSTVVTVAALLAAASIGASGVPEVDSCGADPGPVGSIAAASCEPGAVVAELERLRAIVRWASCRLAARPVPDREAPRARDATRGGEPDDEPPPYVRPEESERIEAVLAALADDGWRATLRACAGAAEEAGAGAAR